MELNVESRADVIRDNAVDRNFLHALGAARRP
jgi:hypothetical protein